MTTSRQTANGQEPQKRAEPARLSATNVKRLRRIIRLRRRVGWALLAAPLLLVVGLDLVMRGDRLAVLSGKYVASYAAACLESGLLWGLLLVAVASQRGVARWFFGSAFIVLATLSVGGQIYFHGQYSTYLNLDATLFGTSFSDSLFSLWGADARNYGLTSLPPLLIATGLAVISAKTLRPRRSVRRFSQLLAPMAIVGVFLIPCSYRTVQASTPDVIYFHAVGGLIKQLAQLQPQPPQHMKPGVRTPPALPALSSSAPRPRNVLLIITEAVRADAHCSAYQKDCEIAPRVNALYPDRLPLTQLRSTSSATAIQLAVMWTGLMPSEPRRALHEAPVLFDYAAAAGRETAYWTSHHMMFANSRLWVQDLPTRFQCGATDLDPLADIDVGARDELLTARINEQLPQLKEPWFAVAHYGNTHVPYLVDDADAPFQPHSESKATADNEAYRNRYKNAVHRQDKAIAAMLQELKQSPAGDRTVVIFTSDHAEGFREHGQLGHTVSVFDEEIHVPGWVAAPDGTLTDRERAALSTLRDRPVLHTDVAPTVLDLMGLLEASALAPFIETMRGHSWLRTYPEKPAPISLTNCAGVWGCAMRNWGVIQGSRKLAGREWEPGWRCYDVLEDPEETSPLPPEACADLEAFGADVFGGPPAQ